MKITIDGISVTIEYSDNNGAVLSCATIPDARNVADYINKRTVHSASRRLPVSTIVQVYAFGSPLD